MTHIIGFGDKHEALRQELIDAYQKHKHLDPVEATMVFAQLLGQVVAFLEVVDEDMDTMRIHVNLNIEAGFSEGLKLLAEFRKEKGDAH